MDMMKLLNYSTFNMLSTFTEALRSVVLIENHISTLRMDLLQKVHHISVKLSVNKDAKMFNEGKKNSQESTNVFESTSKNSNIEEKSEFKQENHQEESNLVKEKFLDYECETFVKKVGVYSVEERLQKILKYKLKLSHYRRKFPIERKYQGRSLIASSKVRSRGRFVKQVSSKKILFKVC